LGLVNVSLSLNLTQTMGGNSTSENVESDEITGKVDPKSDNREDFPQSEIPN